MEKPFVTKSRGGMIYIGHDFILTIGEALDLSRRIYKCAVDPPAIEKEMIHHGMTIDAGATLSTK